MSMNKSRLILRPDGQVEAEVGDCLKLENGGTKGFVSVLVFLPGVPPQSVELASGEQYLVPPEFTYAVSNNTQFLPHSDLGWVWQSIPSAKHA